MTLICYKQPDFSLFIHFIPSFIPLLRVISWLFNVCTRTLNSLVCYS
ncbi:hypothetical protein CSB69_1444 [Morganella morganii]|nr:hypothetical protein CSB69_1444 [Morganella morganii]EMP50080.1 hypothetical protein C790_02752 [Morganella morganii SC01]